MDGLEQDGFTLLQRGLERLESSMRSRDDGERSSTVLDATIAGSTLAAVDSPVKPAGHSRAGLRAVPVDAGGDLLADSVTDDASLDCCRDEPVDTRVHFARCADGNGTLSHLFFSNDAFDLARAQAICSRCGLAEQCRATAIERVEPYGVWGGALIIDGVEVAAKRGRGRPPKHPRPPVVVDEVPLPPRTIAS